MLCASQNKPKADLVVSFDFQNLLGSKGVPSSSNILKTLGALARSLFRSL